MTSAHLEFVAHLEFIKRFSDYKFTDDDAWALFKSGWDAALENNQVELVSTECPPCNNHCKQGRECPSRYK